MVEEIKHIGRIVDITPQGIIVEIIAEDACASCHAASLCGMSELKKKQIDVPLVPGYEVGEEVWVNMKRSLGMKAVWVAYIFPLILMTAVLLILNALSVSEVICGLGAIGIVACSYLVVYLLRNVLKNEYTFYIKKK